MYIACCLIVCISHAAADGEDWQGALDTIAAAAAADGRSVVVFPQADRAELLLVVLLAYILVLVSGALVPLLLAQPSQPIAPRSGHAWPSTPAKAGHASSLLIAVFLSVQSTLLPLLLPF